MNAGEVIEALKAFPPETIVYAEDTEYGAFVVEKVSIQEVYVSMAPYKKEKVLLID